MSNEELLKAWDAGQPIKTVEMGGLGDDYEMAIQLAGMEWLRLLLEHNPDFETMSPDEGKAEMRRLEPIVARRIIPLGLHHKYGMSGAQWGAAANLGSVFYRMGYEPSLESVSADRHITIMKRTFSQEPAP